MEVQVDMNVKIRSVSVTNSLIFLMFSFASMDLFQFAGKTYFFYIGVLFIVYMILSQIKLHIFNDWLIIMIFVEFFVSGLFAQFSELNSDYKKTAYIMPFLVVPLFFEAGIFKSLIKRKEEILHFVLKGIKVACIIQFCYIPIQYAFYNYGGVDINQEIFVNLLGSVENASFIRDWVWYPSGITYHSAIIAPLMVLGIVLFNNVYFKILIFVDAMLCGSSTASIGVIVAVILSILFRLLTKTESSKIKQHVIIMAMSVIIVLAIMFLNTDLLSLINGNFEYILERFFSSSRDSSTSAHMLYFIRYPSIFLNSSLPQKLFGYGYNCSGAIFSVIDNRFNVGNWAIESEIMDRLYSLGIVGFLLYSIFLLNIIIKGKKIDSRYTIIVLSIVIQGFGYNLQWDYVFLIELIFYICIKMNINIFKYQ